MLHMWDSCALFHQFKYYYIKMESFTIKMFLITPRYYEPRIEIEIGMKKG